MKAILIASAIAFATPALSKGVCGNYTSFTSELKKIGSVKIFEFKSRTKRNIEIWLNSNKVLVISKNKTNFCLIDMGETGLMS